MDFKNMTIEALEERKRAIIECLESAENLDELEEEMKGINAELEERRAAEAAALEERKAAATEGDVIKDGAGMVEPEPAKEREMDRSSAEYRNAFYEYIATGETRAISAISADTNGGVAIPTSLDEAIWDNIHTAHPVLNDISVVRSGVILKVTKHTAITAGKAAGKSDTTEQAEEKNTFVEVNLVGKDYSKFVTLTYAEAKMSQGAMEDYLAKEIAADIGEAMAKDVFSAIDGDAVAATAKATAFATVSELLGKAVGAVKPVIYCNAANYYALMGAVDTNGQPIFRDGVAIGAEVKIDSAATGYVCVDPNQFVLNVVQDVMIETDRDVKQHVVVVSGYARAQGCLRNNNAASKVATLIAG